MPPSPAAQRAFGIPAPDLAARLRAVPGLVAHWPLSDATTALRDVVGGAVVSTTTGTPPTPRASAPPPAHQGNVLRWLSGAVNATPAPAALPRGDARRTVLLRWRTTATGVMVPFSYGTAGGPESVMLFDFNYPALGNLTVNTWGTLTKVWDGPVHDGRWHTMAFAYYGGGRAAAYVDHGAPFRWTQGAIATLGGVVGIGYDAPQATFLWDGQIADIAVWSRPISLAEFRSLVVP